MMKAKDITKIKNIVFFIGYDWDVHNQVEYYIAQAAKLSSYKLSTIGIFCNGQNEYLNDTCELLKDVKNSDKSHVCERCSKSKLKKFSDVFDSTCYLFNQNIQSFDFSDIISDFESLDEIKKRNILSPLLSIYRASSSQELRQMIDSNQYINHVIKYYSSFLASSEYWIQICDQFSLTSEDTVVIMFNGRFHPYSSILSVLIEKKIDCILHERGTLPDNWRIAKNTVPYDILSLMMWTDKNLSSIDFTASAFKSKAYMRISDFMEKRYSKGQQNFLDFNGTIQLDKSIRNLIRSPKKKVVYYTSSLDEICIFHPKFTYSEQLKSLKDLAVSCNEQGFELIVRQHPNLGQIGSPTEADDYLANARLLQQNYGFTIIEPNDKCHWSVLASSASLNIVPYSSLYIDIMYFGYPCISLGPDAHLGALTINALGWKESIRSIENTSKAMRHLLSTSFQKRRTKIFAYAFYLGSCVEISNASVINNYMPFQWKHLDTSSPDEIAKCHALVSSLLSMNDFPMSLTT